jgi:hypothetical protein
LTETMNFLTTAFGVILLILGLSPLSQATTRDRDNLSAQSPQQPSHPVEYAIHIPAEENVDYDTYYNNRFEYVVKYPENLLDQLPPPQNNDGRSFVSPQGSINMAVSGSHNVPQRNLNEIYQNRLQAYQEAGRVTYKTQQDNWFVISGYKDGNVFYTKTFLYNNDVLELRLNYDRSLQPEFDAIVAQISNSFMPVGDYQW